MLVRVVGSSDGSVVNNVNISVVFTTSSTSCTTGIVDNETFTNVVSNSYAGLSLTTLNTSYDDVLYHCVFINGVNASTPKRFMLGFGDVPSSKFTVNGNFNVLNNSIINTRYIYSADTDDAVMQIVAQRATTAGVAYQLLSRNAAGANVVRMSITGKENTAKISFNNNRVEDFNTLKINGCGRADMASPVLDISRNSPASVEGSNDPVARIFNNNESSDQSALIVNTAGSQYSLSVGTGGVGYNNLNGVYITSTGTSLTVANGTTSLKQTSITEFVDSGIGFVFNRTDNGNAGIHVYGGSGGGVNRQWSLAKSSNTFSLYNSSNSIVWGVDVSGTTNGLVTTYGTVRPSTNNSDDLGTATLRWKNIYSANALNVGHVAEDYSYNPAYVYSVGEVVALDDNNTYDVRPVLNKADRIIGVVDKLPYNQTDFYTNKTGRWFCRGIAYSSACWYNESDISLVYQENWTKGYEEYTTFNKTTFLNIIQTAILGKYITVNVTGTIQRGDYLVASSIDGVVTSMYNTAHPLLPAALPASTNKNVYNTYAKMLPNLGIAMANYNSTQVGQIQVLIGK